MKSMLKTYLMCVIGALVFIAALVVPAVLAFRFNNLWLLLLYILTLPCALMIVES